MRRKNAHRLPARPMHLYAEFISAEHDGIGKTQGSVLLHMEFEKDTLSVPISFSVPDGEGHTAIIRLTDSADALDRITDTGAVFTLVRGDALGIAKRLKRLTGSRSINEEDALAWVLLRVHEYVRSRNDITGAITLHGGTDAEESARLAALCGEEIEYTYL